MDRQRSPAAVSRSFLAFFGYKKAFGTQLLTRQFVFGQQQRHAAFVLLLSTACWANAAYARFSFDFLTLAAMPLVAAVVVTSPLCVSRK